jgi:urease gamma subunit
MSIDVLIMNAMHKKAAAKGVDLNDLEAFAIFNENVARVTKTCEHMVSQVVEAYKCQGCKTAGEVQQVIPDTGVPCSSCEEKRRALEALQSQGVIPEHTLTVGHNGHPVTTETIGAVGNAAGSY